VVVTLLAFPLAYVSYGLNWSRQRRDFLQGHESSVFVPPADGKPRVRQPPWPLFLIGETPVGTLYISAEEDTTELRSLFPETTFLHLNGLR
jgi:hypothetical protein